MSVYAVYACVDVGARWELQDVFGDPGEADRLAATLVESDKARDHGDPYGQGHHSEAIVVPFTGRGEAERELTQEHAVPIVSRYGRGARAPGPVMEVSARTAFGEGSGVP